MTFINTVQRLLCAQRERTLELLAAVEQLPDPMAALRWQPGEGRANIGWQLTHIGITEELFATERLAEGVPGFAELRERFQRGSTPDQSIPSPAEIRSVLAVSREHLCATLETLRDEDLAVVLPGLQARGWTLEKALGILVWHEAHHQGQAHLTLNLYKAQSAGR
jgi:uncharacterized damage-inducible protein DinB